MLVYHRNQAWPQFALTQNRMNQKYPNGNCLTPATNITERNDDFVVQMALPGYDKKEIVIDVDNNVLMISSKMQMQDAENDTVLKREFRVLPFERKFEIPESVDTDKIEASFKNGVLNILIPKKEYAKAKPPREIAIA